jgi:hypothetical protein
MSKQLNPFPAEAVATFGKRHITCDALSYLLVVGGELNGYLTAYPRENARYGGAIALTGRHGSGKTHVLDWLASIVTTAKSIRGTTLYGKCDSGSIFDLYRQFVDQLDRSKLIELIQLALLSLARLKVRSAKITESLALRLEAAGALQLLQAEGNLDLEQLRQELLTELERTSAASQGMVRILLEVPNPGSGESAYRWLSGHEIEDSAMLGVSSSLQTLPRDGVADSDTSAISALEMIAALHQIAHVPLLILIDQLEVLLRNVDSSSSATIASLLKKLIEQLGSQGAMTVLAGVPEAWQKLPRDVSARFRLREPVPVGQLSAAETKLLVGAYVGDEAASKMNMKVLETIHRLSGGSPREILRIAYHVWEEKGDAFDSFDEAAILRSAARSGSVGDRAKVALSIIDYVFQREGGRVQELSLDGERVDRAILGENNTVHLAIVVLKATDALEEVEAARRMSKVRSVQEKYWPTANLIFVAVGYSSPEVRSMTGSDSILLFDERTFEETFRARVVMLSPKRGPSPELRESGTSEVRVAQTIEKLAFQLEQLEKERTRDLQRVYERFERGAKELAAPKIAAVNLKTRQEIVDALDGLADALRKDDSDEERRLLRSILIANESHIHNPLLEELGELYREALSLERFERGGNNQDKLQLMRAMRVSVRRTSWIELVLLRGIWPTVLIGIFLILAGLSYLISRIVVDQLDQPLRILSVMFVVIGGGIGYAWLTYAWLNRMKNRRSLRQFDHLRASPAGSLRANYPQA